MTLVIEPVVVDSQRRQHAIAQARRLKLKLPTFSQLANPPSPSSEIWTDLMPVAPDEPSAANLWRMHWYEIYRACLLGWFSRIDSLSYRR